MSDWPPFDPAVSDGCSDGLRNLARHCCVEHDRAYWDGRTAADRAAADEELRRCIQAAGRGPHWWLLGWLRWAGVRLLGRRAFWGKLHKEPLR